MYEISSKIGFEVVKLTFGYFTSKTQTFSRLPNDSPRKTFLPSQDWRKIGGNIRVNKVGLLATRYTNFPKQST